MPTYNKPLTDTFIRNLPYTKAKPRPNMRPLYKSIDHFDGGKGSIVGLFVRVGKESKVFYYRYENSFTKQKVNYKIGAFDLMMTQEARKRAKKKYSEVIDGNDPQKDRMAKIEAGTVAEYSLSYRNSMIKKKSNDYEKYMHTKYIVPFMGDKKIWEVLPLDIEKLRNKYEDKIHTANRMRVYCNKFFKWAVKNGFIQSNPAGGISGFKEESKMVEWKPWQIKGVQKALKDLGKDPQNKVNVIYISLLFLTGRRQGELFSLRWAQIDLKNKLMETVDTKRKELGFEISAPAVQQFKALKQITGNSIWCFPSPYNPETHRKYFDDFWDKIRDQSGVKHSMHKIRNYFARTNLDLGIDNNTIGHLLGHKDGSMVARVYGDSTEESRKKALLNSSKQLSMT